MQRRTLLGLPGLAGLAALAAAGTAGCSDREDPAPTTTERDTMTRHAYGDDPSQYGDLLVPDGTARGVVVVVHGGFWKSAYGADALGLPLAEALVAQGWAAWNLEYRRVGTGSGGGGGAPETFDDVAAGIDHLARLDVDTSTVVTLGHSAGGHLAAWAAARGRFGWPEQVPVTHVVAQAGVLDLRAAHFDGLGAGAVEALLGHPPTTADARFDPAQQLPVGVPVWCVHARGDANVPFSQSERYIARARATGGEATLVEVDGDHFTVIDTASEAWTRQLAILDTIG